MINNAGVALAGRSTELSLDEFDWLLEINFRAVLTLTHALLPVAARSTRARTWSTCPACSV